MVGGTREGLHDDQMTMRPDGPAANERGSTQIRVRSKWCAAVQGRIRRFPGRGHARCVGPDRRIIRRNSWLDCGPKVPSICRDAALPHCLSHPAFSPWLVSPAFADQLSAGEIRSIVPGNWSGTYKRSSLVLTVGSRRDPRRSLCRHCGARHLDHQMETGRRPNLHDIPVDRHRHEMRRASPKGQQYHLRLL